MSQARLTLRPPPNVEFVVGYPGIPAGHDRPHAEVRGTLELRLGSPGTKAKWVRIELKKLETLPGGGPSNTLVDYVGQSPLKLWEADGDWSVLNNQDFPFAIRIPESIPPTIALEKGAGIKYELNASLCVKGKKSFFFKKQDTVLSTSHPIIIDKHELHSTWPIYAQPESRSVVDELLILTVERTHTCFGPGDRVKVIATFRNDGIPAAALRGFEFLLKETIIYRAGPHASGKKGAPQVHVTPIGEQKVPVNLTIYQGQQHRGELGCFIPQTHTTTTVGAARHIDIAYSINVKAILASGKPLLMELPVTVSNWPRNMSIEAIRRIGHAPNLSLPQTAAGQQATSAATGITRPTAPHATPSQLTNFNTTPSHSNHFQVHPHQIDERIAMHSNATSATVGGMPGSKLPGSKAGYDDFGFSPKANASASQNARPTTASSTDDYADTARRPYVNTNQTRRLTITNAELDPEEHSPPAIQETQPKKFLSAYEEKKLLQGTLSNASSGAGASASSPMPSQVSRTKQTQQQRTAWPSAEEEKRRLYETAKQQASKTQANMGIYNSPVLTGALTAASTESTSQGPSMPVPESVPTPKKSTPWPTAEEEKLRLYNEAQNAARMTQAQGTTDGIAGSSNTSAPPPSSRDGNPTGSSQEPRSMGAQIYQHAMASVNRPVLAQNYASNGSTRPMSSGSTAQRPGASSDMQSSSYPSAEEEKSALRYYEAKRAVDRAQNSVPQVSPPTSVDVEEPIAYDALYPSGPSTNGIKPPANASSAAGHRPQRRDRSIPRSAPPSPPQWPNQNTAILNAVSEKERLRRRYEAEDATATSASSHSLAGPPPANSPPSYGVPGSPPSHPGALSTGFHPSMPLTAAEEKARLKAQMEAEDRAAQLPPNVTDISNGAYATSSSYSQVPSRSGSLSRGLPNGLPPVRGPSLSYANRSGSHPYTKPVLPEENHVQSPPPPPPPPLAPRPPVEYIQETKDEDERTRAEDHMLSEPKDTLSPPGNNETNGESSRLDFGLPFRPFSPFHVGFDQSRSGTPPPPPPLPPRLPVQF